MKNQELLRTYLNIINETVNTINEKWGTPTKVSPEEKGKYAGKTKAELLKHYNALKKSGPHKKDLLNTAECVNLLSLFVRRVDGAKSVMNNIMRNFINIINETHISYGHKISKDSANYTDHSWSGEMCNNCEHYLRPNRCELVDGFIEPGGWCRYFEEE